jgi:Flp pilus assembly protein TadB
MTDERQVQETQADERTQATVREAQDVRQSLQQSLKALDAELQRARRLADELQPGSMRPTRRRFHLPWATLSF